MRSQAPFRAASEGDGRRRGRRPIRREGRRREGGGRRRDPRMLGELRLCVDVAGVAGAGLAGRTQDGSAGGLAEAVRRMRQEDSRRRAEAVPGVRGGVDLAAPEGRRAGTESGGVEGRRNAEGRRGEVPEGVAGDDEADAEHHQREGVMNEGEDCLFVVGKSAEAVSRTGELLRDTLSRQRAKGLAKYGRPLTPDVEVDGLMEALAEVVDAVAYLQHADKEELACVAAELMTKIAGEIAIRDMGALTS